MSPQDQKQFDGEMRALKGETLTPEELRVKAETKKAKRAEALRGWLVVTS